VRLVYTQISPGHIWTTLYINWISRGVFVRAFAFVNAEIYENNAKHPACGHTVYAVFNIIVT